MNQETLIAFIPVIVPVLVACLKLLWPKIPKVWLPIVAPFLGAGIDIIASGTFGPGTAWGAALGSAGVGLREAFDQIRKSRQNGATTSTSSGQ